MNTFKKFLEKFTFFQNDVNKSQPFVYVALGDSTAKGEGATSPTKTYPAIIHIALKNTYKKSAYYNLGESRAKVSTVIDKQMEQATTHQPNLITISIGANDIFKRVSVKTFTVQLEQLLSRLSEETDATIVITTIPDFSAVPSIPRVLKTYCVVQGIRFNEIIRSLAEKYNCTLVDFYSQTKILGKNYPEIFASDGLHPSDIGYALWAHAILVKIEDILKKKTGIAPITDPSSVIQISDSKKGESQK
jgi:lysophospholipase L1-like esterase